MVILDDSSDADGNNGSDKTTLGVLYEQADPAPGDELERFVLENLKVLIPSRFVYRQVAVSSVSWAASVSDELQNHDGNGGDVEEDPVVVI